jgi:hypothetical protein
MSDDLKLPYQPKILNVPTTSTGEVIDKTPSPNSSSPVNGNQEPPSITDLFKKAFEDPNIKKTQTSASFTESYDYSSAAPFMQGFGHSGFVGNESAEYNAQNQRWYHQLANGVSKGLGLMGTTLISGTVGTLNGVFDVVNSMAQGKPNFSKLYDNDVNTAMDQFNQHMEKWFPNYYSKKELEAPALSADNLLTMNFFADKLIKNAGFAAGAILEGYLTAGLASATGLGKLSWGYRNAVRLGKIESMAMSHGDDAVAMGKQLLDFASKQTRNLAQIENANINKMATFLSTMGEASMEAYEGKKRIREELITQQTQILGRDLTADELQQIEEKAETSGNIRMALNVALLNVTNSIQFPKILNGGFKGERQALGREINEIAVNGLDNSVIGKTAKTGQSYIAKLQADKLKGIEKIWDYSKKAATIISPSESFEEGSQYIFDKATARNAGVMTEDEVEKAKSSYSHNVNDFMNRSSDPMKMAEFEDVISSSVKSLFNDKEGIESMILGGLTGGIMEKIGGGDRKESARKTQNTNNAINLFNNNLASGYMQEMAKSGVTSLSIEEDKMNKIASGDIMGSQNLREDAFINFAMPRLFYGRGDMAKDELMQYHSSQMKFEDAKKELGLADDMTSEKLDAIAENSVKDLEKLEKILTHVEAVSPMLFGKDGTINPLAKGLLYAGYKIDSFENRINTMVAELNKIGLTEANLLLDPKARKEAGYDFESLRNKLNAEIKSVAGKIIDPVTKLPIDVKEYQDKVNDVERLQNLRESYITDYAQLKDGSFFSNAVLQNGFIDEKATLNDYEKYENYMMSVQRNLEYTKNTNSRRTAASLSNEIEQILISKKPIDFNVLSNLAQTLKDKLGTSYLMESDKKHIEFLLEEVKKELSSKINLEKYKEIGDELVTNLENTLKGAPNSKTISEILKTLAQDYRTDPGVTEKELELIGELEMELGSLENDFITLMQIQESLNNINNQAPVSKTLSELKREIANGFTEKANAVLSSYHLDEEGFTDIQELQIALNVVKQLKRLFSERNESFFEDNKKGFNNKTEYIKTLTDLIIDLEDALEKTKINSENIQKNDDDFASINRINKARIFGYDIVSKSIFDQPLYDSIASIVGESQLKDLLKKHEESTSNKYIYELYNLYRTAINTNKSLGVAVLNKIESDLKALEKESEALNTSTNISFNNRDVLFKTPHKYFDLIVYAFGNNDLKAKYKQSQNMELLLQDIKANPSNLVIENNGEITQSEFIKLLEIGLKQKELIELQKLTLLNSSFNYSKFWDALEEHMISTKNGITPTFRQLQVVEDMIMHLFTNNPNTEFSNWAYLNGRIGSGKTKVIASTLLKVYSDMTGQADFNSFVYLLGDTKIAGINLEFALNLHQTSIREFITPNDGRDINMLIEDLNKDHKDLKGKRFLLGDEFARAPLADIKKLDAALLEYNKRNGTSLFIIAMGDTNQSSSATPYTGITTIHPNLNLVTPLGTSYRSLLFSINMVQALYDNAKFLSIKDYRQSIIDEEKLKLAAENDPTKKAKIQRKIDGLKLIPDVISVSEMDSQGNLIVGGKRLGVKGVEKGTSFAQAEIDLINDLAIRSNKINLPKDPSLPVSDTNPIENRISIAVVVNKDEVDSFKLKLEQAGAKLSNISVLNIAQAQGLTFSEVYVHISPNAKEYKNGQFLDKYNADMYTALRAELFIHISTLESNNINDESLINRVREIANQMQNSGDIVRKEINEIKMHLNPIVKAPPKTSGGATKTTAGKATKVSNLEVNPKLKAEPTDFKKDELQKIIDDIKSIVADTNSNIIKPLNDLYEKKFQNDELIAKRDLLEKQIAAEADDAKKVPLQEELDKLPKPEDPVAINEKIKILDDSLIAQKEKIAFQEENFEKLKNEKAPGAGPSSTTITDPNDAVLDFTIDDEDSTKTFTSTTDEVIIDFKQNDDANTANIISIASPTSSSFSNKNDLIPAIMFNDKLIIVPVLKNNKRLVVVYRPVMISGTLYYQELGALNQAQYDEFVSKGYFKAIADINFKRPTANFVTNTEIAGNDNIYTLIGYDENNLDSYVPASLDNIENLHYNYAYSDRTATQRDGQEYTKLIETWARTMGIPMTDIKSHKIQTITNKFYTNYVENYRKVHGTDVDNKIPIKPGRTYIVITRKGTKPVLQYIELEPRTLIVDDIELNNPVNAIMNEWYIKPLNKFVNSVDDYHTVLLDILEKLGITKDELQSVINQAKITKTVNGQTVTVTEEVSVFEHGNQFYNELMYSFLNMDFDSKNPEKPFKNKGTKEYAKQAGLLFSKIFSKLDENQNKDYVKVLMEKSRNVYGILYTGNDLVNEIDSFYDIVNKKTISTDDKTSTYVLPKVSLKNTKFKLGGAQTAMNLIAFGNQNIQVEENGELINISTGRIQRENGKSRYIGRPLNSRKGLEVDERRLADRLFLNVIAQNFTGEVSFSGYQDEILTKDIFNSLREESGLSLNYNQFIQTLKDHLKKEMASKNVKSVTFEEFDEIVSNFETAFKSNPDFIKAWDLFQKSVVSVVQNSRTIGHNASSIKNDILNSTTVDGTRNQLGVKNYNGKPKQIGLRMNIPFFMSNSKSTNWSNSAEPSNRFIPSTVSPEERFKMFFTSAFTGVNQTKLDVHIDNYSNDASNTNLGPDDRFSAPADSSTPEPPIVQGEPENITQPIELDIETPSDSNITTFSYNGVYLTTEQFSNFNKGNAVELSNGDIINNKDNELSDDDAPIPFLKVDTIVSDNQPSGEGIQQMNDMYSYLKNFIPDLTLEELQLLTSLEAENAFGSQNGTVYGAFKNGVIYAVRNDPNDSIFKQVLKHEAFHKIFRQYLTPYQRKQVIQQAREEYDLFGMNDLQVEEYLSVNFQKRPDFKRDSLLQRFLNFLKRLYRLIFRHSETIEDFYKKIENGKFKTKVAEQYQFKSNEAAFLSNTLENFKNQEHLINVLKGLYNTARIYSNPNYNKEVGNAFDPFANSPLSEHEIVFKTISSLSHTERNYKDRFMQTHGKTFYLDSNGKNKLSPEDIKQLDIKITPIYELSNGTYIPINVETFKKPLTNTEYIEFSALQIAFSQRIFSTKFNKWVNPFQGKSIYPNLLQFVSDLYPSDLKNVKQLMQVGKELQKIEKELNLAIEDAGKEENENELTEDVLKGLEEEKDVISILTDILNKDKAINPNKTLTDAAKTWLSGLYVTNPDKSKTPINPKQALAILYQSFNLFNTSTSKNFIDELTNAMSNSVFTTKYLITDFDFLRRVINGNPNSDSYKFLQRIATEYRIPLNESNLKLISDKINFEYNALITSVAKGNGFTKMALGNVTIFDLYNNDNFYITLNNIQKEYDDSKLKNNNLSDYELLKSKIEKDVQKIKGTRLKNLKEKKRQYLENDSTNVEELNKIESDIKSILDNQNKTLLEELNKLDTIPAEELKIQANEYRRYIKTLRINKNINKYQTDSYIKDLKKKNLRSGFRLQEGRPTDIVIYNKLVELANSAYSNKTTIKNSQNEDIPYVFDKNIYFIDENTFYLNGVIIKRNEALINNETMFLRGADLSNKAFFKRIYKAWGEDYGFDNSYRHSQVIVDMYKKFKSNEVFLDIVNNFNTLVPSNLTRFEIDSAFGVYSTNNMNMLVSQEDDSEFKTLFNINNAILTALKDVKNGMTVLNNAKFKKFEKDYFDLKNDASEISAGSYDTIYKDFLNLIGLSGVYEAPSVHSPMQTTITSILKIVKNIATHANFNDGPIAFDNESDYDPNVLFNDMQSYTKKISKYINRNKEIKSNTSTKDINKNTRFLRDRKTYAHNLINLINKLKTTLNKKDAELYINILKEQYPHLTSESMMLNPFNPLNLDYDNVNNFTGVQHTLDGTLSNDFPIEIGRESLKDIINRMLNGHFIGQMNKFTTDGKANEIFATSYPIADKEKFQIIPTNVYSLKDPGSINKDTKTVKDLIKSLIQQRLMMPKENNSLQTYSVWKDKKGEYVLKGLENEDIKEDLNKLMDLTGTFASYEELEKANIDYTPFINAIYNNMEEQSSRVIGQIIKSNKLALSTTDNKYINAKIGIPIPSNLAEFYSKLLTDNLLDPSMFSDSAVFEVTQHPDTFKYIVTIKDFVTTASGYNVTQEHLKPLVDLFIANTYINDFFYNQLVMGDPAFFPDAVTVVKRLSTPHGNIISPVVSSEHAPSKIRTVVTDDIITYSFTGIRFSEMPAGFKKEYTESEYVEFISNLKGNDRVIATKNYAKREWTDGGGMMSQRGRDAINKGYGTSNKLQHSIKPLTHFIDPINGPRNNKYALNVLTDELCKQFPLMLEQRIKMDFYGLTPEKMAIASKLERIRVNKGTLSIEDLRKLNALYNEASPIIQSVPLSAIKYGKIVNPTSFNYDTKNFNAFEESSIIDFETAEWGYQLDPEDTADSKISLPTQLLYFTNVNGNNPEIEANILKAINGLQNIQEWEYQKFDINGTDRTNLKNMSDMIIDSLQGKDNQINLMQALIENSKMLNLPTFSTAGVSSYNNLFQKGMLALKFKGTKGVQISEALTEDLKGKTLEWDSETQTAEVYMSASYMELIKNAIPSELYINWYNEKNAVKKHELEQQIIKELPVIMLGFRIPSTGPNSAVRIKIKGFLHDNSNRIILPNELVYRIGADFDIDVLYVLRPEFLNFSNKIKNKAIAEALNINIKHPIGFSNFDGDEIYDFEDRIKTLQTKNEITTTIKNAEGEDVVKTFILSDKDIKTIYKSYYNNLFGLSYTSLLKKESNLNDVNKPLNFDRAKSIVPQINITDNADGTKSYNFNDSLYVILAGLKSPSFKEKYELAKRNVSIEENYSESILDPKKQNELAKEMNSLIEKTYNLTDFIDRSNLQILNQTGKSLTGVFASFQKTLAYIQSSLDSNFEIDSSLQFSINGIVYGDINSAINDPNNPNKNRFFDSNGISSFDELQWLVNAAVDNAKEQILAKLNINSVTSDVVTSSLLVGIPMETQMVLLQQPVVKELIELGFIREESISFIRKELIKSTGQNPADFKSDDIVNLINEFKYSTNNLSNDDDVINLEAYVNAKLNVKLKSQVSLKYSELKDTHFLSPKFKHAFTYNNVEYNNLSDAVDKINEEYKRNIYKEDNVSKEVTGLVKEKFKNQRNVAYEDLLKTYFKSFPDELLNDFNSIKSISIADRNEFQQKFLEIFKFYKDKRYNDYVLLNPNTKDDKAYFASQLYTLDLISKLSKIGRSVNHIRKMIKVMDDSPNGSAEILEYQHVMGEILDLKTIHKYANPEISNKSSYETTSLPPAILRSGNAVDDKLPPGVELKLKDNFAIKNLDISKLGKGLFKMSYDRWYNFDYLPVKNNIFLMHPQLEKLSSVLQNIYNIRPKAKNGEYLNAFEKDMLIRNQILKMFLSKAVIKHPDINGNTIVTPMDTVGITKVDFATIESENNVLYNELTSLISNRMTSPINQNNEFLLKLSAGKFNSFIRSGEITMNRSNTSDPNELKSMQSSFLQIDNDLRQEFLKNNPDSKEYWFSPLQLKLIQYAVALEGLAYGSSKISQFLPHAVLDQFSDQFDLFFKDVVDTNSFNSLEQWIAFYFAGADPTWTPDTRYKDILSDDEQIEILTNIESNDDSKSTFIADTENPESTRANKKGRGIKYDRDNKVFYNMAIKRNPKNPINSYPIFLTRSYFGKNPITYVRINKEAPIVNDVSIVYYLAMPKTPSVTPKLPNQVLIKGFNISSVNHGGITFIKEINVNKAKGKVLIYNNADLAIGSTIYSYDESAGYIQNLNSYRVISKEGQKDDAVYLDTLKELDRSNLSAARRVELQNRLNASSIKYFLEVQKENVSLQDEFPATTINPSLSNLELLTIQNNENSEIINNLKMFIDQSDRNTFNVQYYNDEELADLNKRKLQITCNK